MPTVIGEDGEQKELTVGALVWCDDYKRWGRVECLFPLSEEYFVQAEFGYGRIYPRLDRTILLNPDPLPDDEKGLSFYERRNNLFSNIDRLQNRLDGDDWRAVSQLRQFLYGSGGRDWFWKSVAESADNPRQVSYAPEEKFLDVDARRRRCSWKKFLSGQARENGLDFTDEQVDRLSNLIGQHFPANYDYDFEIVSGADEIEKAYTSDEQQGSFGSCMTDCHYVRWYGGSGEKCRLVKILRGGEYIGRALLWNTDEGTTVLDRVYPSDNGPHTAAVHAFAEKNGWVYKTRQCCGDGYLSSDVDYTVTMKASSNGTYPYCDTFKYTDDDPENSNLLVMRTDSGDYCFNSTGGDYEESSRCVCEECGCRLNEDDAHWHGDCQYCESCYNENFVYLNYRGPNGRYREGSYDIDDTTECEHCSERRLSGDCHSVTVNGCEQAWCFGCVEQETTCCEKCGECIPCEESRAIDDEYFCGDCADKIEDGQEDEEDEAEETAEAPAPVSVMNETPPEWWRIDGYRSDCLCRWCLEHAERQRDLTEQARAEWRTLPWLLAFESARYWNQSLGTPVSFHCCN